MSENDRSKQAPVVQRADNLSRTVDKLISSGAKCTPTNAFGKFSIQVHS